MKQSTIDDKDFVPSRRNKVIFRTANSSVISTNGMKSITILPAVSEVPVILPILRFSPAENCYPPPCTKSLPFSLMSRKGEIPGFRKSARLIKFESLFYPEGRLCFAPSGRAETHNFLRPAQAG